MDTTVLVGVAAIGFALVGLFLGRWAERLRLERAKAGARDEAERIRHAAVEDADRVRKNAELEGREAAYESREEWEREEARRREETERAEQRVDERRASLDRKLDILEAKENAQADQERLLEARAAEIEERVAEHAEVMDEARRRLEALAGMTAAEAKQELVERLEDEARADAANLIREIQEEAKRDGEREARNIISLAIQRVAADHSADTTISVVSLPSDEMKGRIIGREGRNIRAFEQMTGMDVIIDDTPEAVVVSGFDPVRRETARIALEKLIEDGRIHPGRIEEIVEKSRREVDEGMVKEAEEALYELGIHGVAPEIVKALGRLKYRTSYGQNQLLHSREVAMLAGNMAAELKLDVSMAKRAGLLHDVGKGLTHEHEGTHVELGYNLCKKHGEPDTVLNAIRAHHDEEPHRYPETFLVTAGDAISGARPGARREMFDRYVKRLEKLEEIGAAYPGVERCFAIQAGREVRVMVNPEEIGDPEMSELSERIARRFEDELKYPGQIKVVVIREKRSVDFAR